MDKELAVEILKYKRREKNLTTKEMSYELDINESYIKHYENGNNYKANLNHFFKICKFLKVDIKYLLENEDYKLLMEYFKNNLINSF